MWLPGRVGSRLSTAETARARLQALAVEAASADPGDLRGLAALHTRCETLSADPTVASAARSAADVLASVMLGEYADPRAALAGLLDAPSATAAAPTAGPLAGDPAYSAEFVAEASTLLQTAEVNLLSLETDPSHPEALDAVLRAFHTVKGGAALVGLLDAQTLAHEAEGVLVRVRDGGGELTAAAIDLLFESVDGLRLLVADLSASLATGVAPRPATHLPALVSRLRMAGGSDDECRLGEILVAAGAATAADVDAALAAPVESAGERLGERLVRSGNVSAKEVATALRMQRERHAEHAAEAVRVDPAQLDRLLEASTELTTTLAALRTAPDAGQWSQAAGLTLARLDGLSQELSDLAGGLCLVSLQSVFGRMARLVRDVGVQCGKPVELVLDGAETRVERALAEQLADPLMHLLRNAVDHGLEEPGERAATGKPATARLELRASAAAGEVLVTVSDDGRGLDRERLRRRAVELGALSDGEPLDEETLVRVLCAPGLSTAASVTTVSGRGVGLDVVHRAVQALHGALEVRSERGLGTTFALRLPQNLALLDTLVLGVGEEVFLVAASEVVALLRPQPDRLREDSLHGELLEFEARLLPVRRLRRLFGQGEPTAAAPLPVAVVVDTPGRRLALLADELLGQQQVVVQRLAPELAGTRGIRGAAALGDQRLALVLDAAELEAL